MAPAVLPTKRELAAAFADVQAQERAAGVAKLATVALACDVWSVVDDAAFDSRGEAAPHVLFGERLITPGGAGTPEVAEFLAAELGPGLAISVDAARHLVADVLNLRHRLPILWEHALAGRVREWAARRVARDTEFLSLEQARELDARVSPRVEGWTEQRLFREVDGIVALLDDDAEDRRQRARASRFVSTDPTDEPGMAWLSGKIDAAAAVQLEATLDHGARVLAAGGVEGDHQTRRADTLELLAHPGRAHLVLDQGLPFDLSPGGAVMPQVVDPETGEMIEPCPGACRHGAELVVRVTSGEVSAGMGGTLEGFGPLTRAHLAEVLAGCGSVKVQPAIDLTAPYGVATYRPSRSLAWVVAERDQVELYPYSNRPARSRLIDLDHTIPFGEGGPTESGNLAALSRLIHRAATHGGFRIDQPTPGTLRLRTPAGQEFWTNAHGTHTGPPPDRGRMNDPDTTTTVMANHALQVIARHRLTLTHQATEAAGQARAEADAILGRRPTDSRRVPPALHRPPGAQDPLEAHDPAATSPPPPF